MAHTDVATFLADLMAVVQRVGFTTHTHNFAVSLILRLFRRHNVAYNGKREIIYNNLSRYFNFPIFFANDA